MNRITGRALSRVFCGVVFIVHGYPKIMNLSATTEAFAGMGFPGWMAVPIAIFEFFGGILLAAGFLTRILAALFAAEMVVAGIKVHLPHGFDVYHFGDPMARGLRVRPGPRSSCSLGGDPPRARTTLRRREDPQDAGHRCRAGRADCLRSHRDRRGRCPPPLRRSPSSPRLPRCGLRAPSRRRSPTSSPPPAPATARRA